MKCINSSTPDGNPDAKAAKGKSNNTTGKASDKKAESETGK